MVYDVHQHLTHSDWKMLVAYRPRGDGSHPGLAFVCFSRGTPMSLRSATVIRLRDDRIEDTRPWPWRVMQWNDQSQSVRLEEWEPFSIES